MTNNKKPQWAKSLTSAEWKHVQQGQGRKVPTRVNLVSDSETCDECKRILGKVRRLKEAKVNQ